MAKRSVSSLQVASFIAGAGILAGTAHVTIIHAGGYGEAQAVLTLCVAAGVALAALVMGAVWERKGLAVWLALAILAGEGFGFLLTAERIVTGREAQQAPVRAATEAHAKAAKRVADAEAALARVPDTSDRLTKATAAKAAADQAVIDKAADKGCKQYCQQLLQANVDNAALEIERARKALGTVKTAAETELADARAALAVLAPPKSATPLADRLGLPAWVLDLLTAGLGSMAANGLACGLIAFASHRKNGPAPPNLEALALQASLDAANGEIERLKTALKKARKRKKKQEAPAIPPPAKTDTKRTALKVVGGKNV